MTPMQLQKERERERQKGNSFAHGWAKNWHRRRRTESQFKYSYMNCILSCWMMMWMYDLVRCTASYCFFFPDNHTNSFCLQIHSSWKSARHKSSMKFSIYFRFKPILDENEEFHLNGLKINTETDFIFWEWKFTYFMKKKKLPKSLHIILMGLN